METMSSLNIVPSPLESLDLNVKQLSYGLLTAVSSIWAWFAALTAAVSFWRIKSLSPSPPSSPGPTRGRKACRDEASMKTDGPACGLPPPPPPSPSTKKIATAEATSFYHAMDGECSSPKVKFSVCYREESREYGDGDVDGRDFNDCKENGSNGNICNKDRTLRYCNNRYGDDWKRMTVVRMGDMGWYTWQDISVLDGSVVKLWDVRRGPTNSAVKVVAGGGCW